MNNSPFSAHKDVLDAPVPQDDEAAKQRLLEEVKRRAKAAIGQQAWPDAVALYEKGLQCTTSACDNEECAILNANLSLVHGKMSQWNKAVDCATTATTTNPSYVKGWWRLGQAQAALKDYEKAVAALQQALILEPTNKALEKELSKQQENLKEWKENPSRAPAPAPAPSATTISTPVTKTYRSANAPATMSTSASSTSKASASTPSSSADSKFKGYKVVNGKKTTYFHSELSEEAAQLIGDIAPKKIDNSSSPAAATASGTTTDTSAWNKAGTWEEKDVTKWAKDSLKQQLLTTCATYTLPDSSPAPNATITTSKVTINSGHASVATVRGKKRYLYDFSLKLEWKFKSSSGDDEANGSIEFPDIATGDDEAFEATNFTVSHTDEESLRPILQQYCHKQGWREMAHANIHDWVRLFKETY